MLARARERAVLRGVNWLGRYVAAGPHRSGVGADSEAIFADAALTTTSRRVRVQAMRFAAREARHWYAHFLQPGALRDRNDAMDAAFLDYASPALGLAAEPLLSKVLHRLARIRDPNALYGVDVRHLDRLSEDDLYSLLIDSFTLERLAADHPRRLRLNFGLSDLLRAKRDRSLLALAQDPGGEHWHFQDHAYWASHVAYALDDYGRLRLRPGDTGPIFAYLREQFWGVMRWGDTELVAEFVDVFRQAGLTDRDPEVCAGSQLVLGRQRRDGSFSRWESEHDPYSAVHPTWVAVDGLRDRFFLHGTAYARRERAIAASLHSTPAHV